MKNETEENYVFLQLCDSDLESAFRSHSLASQTELGYELLVFLRDAVVSYGRPFSRNRSIHRKNRTLGLEYVPIEYLDLHNHILSLRNTLFAHSDLTAKEPTLTFLGMNKPKITVSYKNNYLSDIEEGLKNLGVLTEKVRIIIREELQSLELVIQNKTHALSGQKENEHEHT